MIGFTVHRTGRLWERPDIEAALVPAVEEATRLVHRVATDKLRAIGRGPGRYGHIADTLTWETRRLPGLLLSGSVEPKGKAAFRARFLEFGTKPPRRGGLIRPKRKRYRAARLAGRANPTLAFMVGGRMIFRRAVPHPGIPAFYWSLRTQRETSPVVVGILERAVAQVAHDA